MTRHAKAGPERPPRPPGAGAFYAVACLALGVSLNTSWRFFGEVLRVTAVPERVVLFAVVEAGLVACGAGMRAGMRAGHGPGPSRLLAWALTGLSGYAAVVLTGPVEGLARVALGPGLSLVALHLALGLELRHARGGPRKGTWARVRGELRERALSRLGLAHEGRTAATLARDRARTRAVRLAVGRWGLARRARLRRALRAGRVAGDPAAVASLLDQLAVARHADQLGRLELGSPWGRGAQGDHGRGSPGSRKGITRGDHGQDHVIPDQAHDRITTGDHAGITPQDHRITRQDHWGINTGSPEGITGLTGGSTAWSEVGSPGSRAQDHGAHGGITAPSPGDHVGITVSTRSDHGGITRGSRDPLEGRVIPLRGSRQDHGRITAGDHEGLTDQVILIRRWLLERGLHEVTRELIQREFGVSRATATRRLRAARRALEAGEGDGPVV